MDFVTFMSTFRRWWWVVVGLGIVSGVLAFAISTVLPREYTATTRVLVGSLTDTSTDKLTAYQQLAQTYAQVVVTSPSVARIATAAGSDVDVETLATRIETHVPMAGFPAISLCFTRFLMVQKWGRLFLIHLLRS